MERSFLDYAMSVIMARALPDVRDGLKPVHRRILWDMEQQGFRPDRPFVKCARVTGDTMAKYHPHGNSAIYDALVRMAQPFSLRHPLIDFHGNYGSPDFGPAAERYTECRLHPLAMQLLAGIDEDTVDFDAQLRRHQRASRRVLPARFPNLLVNGSQGIAVGMATNIPPHNLGEVIDATIHLIDHPDATPDDLMQFVKGPDFPTGGCILGPGRDHGGLPHRPGQREDAGQGRDRGDGKRGDRCRSSSPSCPTRSSRDADRRPHQGAGRRRRARRHRRRQRRLGRRQDQPRHHAEARRQRQRRAQQPVQADAAADAASRSTWSRWSTACPARSTSSQALQGYVDHQVEVITRRIAVPPGQGPPSERTSSRACCKALNVIDEVIALIRASEDRAAATAGLMAEPFEFSEIQAEHILDMHARPAHPPVPDRPRAASSTTLRGHDRRARGDPRRRRPRCATVIKDELLAIKERVRHAAGGRAHLRHRRDVDRGPRRRQGARRRDDRGRLREDGRGRRVQDPGPRRPRAWPAPSCKTDDLVSHVIFTTAHAYLLFFSNRGKVYRLRAHGDPRAGAHGQGHADRQPAAAGAGRDASRPSSTPATFAGERFLFFATRQGHGEEDRRSTSTTRRRRDGLIALEPARRRRAGAGHRDRRRRRHLHGQPHRA